MTMLRVKNGACAPLRLSSMLSRPATGITSMAVTRGAPDTPAPTACCISLSSSTTGALFRGLPRQRRGQFCDQSRELGKLRLGQVGQRRPHRAGIAADHLHAGLDDRDRIAL